MKGSEKPDTRESQVFHLQSEEGKIMEVLRIEEFMEDLDSQV